MMTSNPHATGRPPTEIDGALDALADLIIEVASDEQQLSALAAKLTELDMAELGIAIGTPPGSIPNGVGLCGQ
jgi:Uma2 family endonuclease